MLLNQLRKKYYLRKYKTFLKTVRVFGFREIYIYIRVYTINFKAMYVVDKAVVIN